MSIPIFCFLRHDWRYSRSPAYPEMLNSVLGCLLPYCRGWFVLAALLRILRRAVIATTDRFDDRNALGRTYDLLVEPKLTTLPKGSGIVRKVIERCRRSVFRSCEDCRRRKCQASFLHFSLVFDPLYRHVPNRSILHCDAYTGSVK